MASVRPSRAAIKKDGIETVTMGMASFGSAPAVRSLSTSTALPNWRARNAPLSSPAETSVTPSDSR